MRSGKKIGKYPPQWIIELLAYPIAVLTLQEDVEWSNNCVSWQLSGLGEETIGIVCGVQCLKVSSTGECAMKVKS